MRTGGQEDRRTGGREDGRTGGREDGKPGKVPIDVLEEPGYLAPIECLEDPSTLDPSTLNPPPQPSTLSVPEKLDLLQGTLDLIVLKLLRAGPANGWELTQSIQVVSKGILDVNYGSLYPALRRIEARGWVKAKWGASENNRRARYYELTSAGRKQLETERAAWERFTHALGLILQSE
jgi:transcriptional regulator